MIFLAGKSITILNKLIFNLVIMKRILFIAGLLLFSMVNNSFTAPAPNEKLVRDYYRAYEKKDWGLLKSILSPGFKFCSPNDDHINLETYHTRCWPNCQ